MSANLRLENVGIAFDLAQKTKSSSILNRIFSSSSMRKGKLNALDSISFTLEPGDRVGIVGVNGAGKSTLLKILAGVLRPTYGDINISGEVYSLLDLNTDVVSNATCLQNIRLKAYSLGLKGVEILKYEKHVRKLADLEKFIHSPFSVLSTGMKTRLLVSMIGYRNSDIVIMDEWIGTTDRSFYAKRDGVLNGLIEMSQIFIIASHNRKIIESLCNKVIVLDSGFLKFIGDVSDGYRAFDELT